MSKNLLLTLLFIAVFSIVGLQANAQGCVAIKNMPCTAMPGLEHQMTSEPTSRSTSSWEISLNSRSFRSYKHFVGSKEQKQRVEAGTEVINKSYSFDIGIVHNFKHRYTASFVIPVIFNHRTSLYEHYGNSSTANPQQTRFATSANGVGDMRFALGYWILDPQKRQKGNFTVGLGIKLPTGNPEVLGDFHKRNASGGDSIVRKAVDQSIQPGDGGLGFSIEVQGYRHLFTNATLFCSGFYLFNPRNTNNNLRGGNNPITRYNSVPDQFAARAGILYYLLKQKNLAVSLGGRMEGLPAHDALGKSEGFRRPGYIISVEPGIGYMAKRTSYQLNVPVALYRNRTKSVDDLADPTGRKHGDAAFADYLVNVSVSYRLSK